MTDTPKVPRLCNIQLMTIAKYQIKNRSKPSRQLKLSKHEFSFNYAHGGNLRNKRKGRKFRPLSKKEPLHLVFKAHRKNLQEKSFRGLRSHKIVHKIVRRYAKRFHVRIDQVSVQNDHIHLLVRCSHRFFYQAFFRVVAGQIAQRFKKERLLNLVTDTPSLWMVRPFTRVVRGFRAYQIVRDYIQLNENEARGMMAFQLRRLRGLSVGEWQLLWS